MAMFSEVYAGTDKAAASAAIASVPEGQSIFIIDGSTIDPRILTTMNILAGFQGTKVNGLGLLPAAIELVATWVKM